jgi:hypothetical protein
MRNLTFQRRLSRPSTHRSHQLRDFPHRDISPGAGDTDRENLENTRKPVSTLFETENRHGSRPPPFSKRLEPYSGQGIQRHAQRVLESGHHDEDLNIHYVSKNRAYVP